MKIKFLPLIVVLFAATSIMTSCLDNDVEQITYNSETSITGFSLGILHIDRMGKDKNGQDSAYVDTIDCTRYPFTINQLTREIENKDSLPCGTHIDKVVTTVVYDPGMLVYRPKDAEADTLWTSTDSIDFSGDTYCSSTKKDAPIEFKVYAYSGVIGQAYKIKVNVHQQVPDTISWKSFNQSFSVGSLNEQKAIYTHGKIYVFGKNGNESHIECSDVSDDNPQEWQTLSLPITDVDTYSATLWNGNIYFLAGTASDKTLYKLDTENNNTITKASEETFNLLIGGNDAKNELYAVKGGECGKFTETAGWDSFGLPDETFSGFPEGTPFFSYTTSLSYNQDITNTVALCHNQGTEESDTAALVFNYMSNEENWVRRNQNLPLPNLENVTMVYYDGKLYAFGGGCSKPQVEAFSQFYCSTDNGLCWRPVDKCMAFPADFKDKYTNHTYSATVMPKLEEGLSKGNFIWIIWENGNIERGRINRLGFNSKW